MILQLVLVVQLEEVLEMILFLIQVDQKIQLR